MTNRVLTFALAFGVAGWLCTPEGRAEFQTAPPAGHPTPDGAMPGVVIAVSPDPPATGLAERDPFQAGALTFQAMAGYYVKGGVGAHGPPVDYAPIAARVGYLFNTPCRTDCLRGCWEALLETNYSRITRSFGTYFTGPNAIGRYNFVQPDCAFVPYIQVGAGFVFNDAWRTPSSQQTLVGERFEFLLRSEGGVRYMISDRISLDVEGGFQHISNGGLARHNGGVNNLGGSLGFTYFYGPCP